MPYYVEKARFANTFPGNDLVVPNWDASIASYTKELHDIDKILQELNAKHVINIPLLILLTTLLPRY